MAAEDRDFGDQIDVHEAVDGCGQKHLQNVLYGRQNGKDKYQNMRFFVQGSEGGAKDRRYHVYCNQRVYVPKMNEGRGIQRPDQLLWGAGKASFIKTDPHKSDYRPANQRDHKLRESFFEQHVDIFRFLIGKQKIPRHHKKQRNCNESDAGKYVYKMPIGRNFRSERACRDVHINYADRRNQTKMVKVMNVFFHILLLKNEL